MEVKVEAPSSPATTMLLSNHQLRGTLLPPPQTATAANGPCHQRQGVILSQVSTPTGLKLVQLIIKQEDQEEEEDKKPFHGTVEAVVDSGHSQPPSQNLCTICGQTFAQKLAFNAHIKVHLKEKLTRRAKLKRGAGLVNSAAGQTTNQTTNMKANSVKRKLDAYGGDPCQQRSRIKVEVEPDIDCLTNLNSLNVQSLMAKPVGLNREEDNFVSSEFSAAMEMNRVDLNNDITSILDEIEKDFDGPSIDLSTVHLDTPPDSDSEASEYWSSLVTSCPSPSSSREGPASFSLASTPNPSVVSGTSLDDRDEISFEKLVDVDELRAMGSTTSLFCGPDRSEPGTPGEQYKSATDSSAQDHDYLVTGEGGARSLTPQVCSPSPKLEAGRVRQQLNIMKPDKIPAGALALLNQVPGRILIQRSATDSRVLNVYGLGRVEGPTQPEARESLERDETTGPRTPQRPSKQSAECSVCGKMITTKNMARHMEKHTGRKKFQCEVCLAAFFQKTHLKNHILLHDSSEFYACVQCDQKFLRKTDYQKHLRAEHSMDSPLCCSVCGAQFTDVLKFELHKHIHNKTSSPPSGERQELCGVCGDKFPSKADMISHMQKHASPTTNSSTSPPPRRPPSTHKPFSCDVCHKTFSQKSHLNRHIKSHGGEQDLVCLVCNRQCKNKLELVRHRAGHLACSLCKGLFDTRVQLQQHMLKSHPVIQPALNSVDPVALDLFDDESDWASGRPVTSSLSRSPIDILSDQLDASPAPSSVDSGSLDLLDTNLNNFLADLSPEDEEEAVVAGRASHNLSIHDIADSSFFDVNPHIEEDLLTTDFFSPVK